MKKDKILKKEEITLFAETTKEMPIPVLICKLDDPTNIRTLRLVKVNSAASKIAGTNIEKFEGMYLVDAFPNITEETLDFYKNIFQTGKPAEIPELAYGDKNVKEGIFRIKAFLLTKDHLAITSEDITKHKKVEKELRESEERTRLIIDNALDAVVVMNTSGLITSWNPQAEVIFGWKNKEVIGKKMSEVIIPLYYREAHEKGLKKFLETGEGPVFNKRLELTAIHQDGHEFPVELTVSPMKLGEEYIFSAFIRDITKQKQAEQELKNMTEELTRSNKELEQFAYVASHDLQEPLRKIIAFGDRLKSHCETALDDKGLDSLEKMQNAAMRMRQLIEDLLHLSRVTTRIQPTESVNLGTVVQEVLSDLELRIKESGTKIEINALPIVNADKLQMYELFQNLILNAIKFRKKDEPPKVIIKSQNVTNNFTEITVEDNGIGFEEKYIDQIFKPFQRLHTRSEYEGSGIGLAICEKIVRRHGGKITAKSEPEKGSKFIIMLPR